MNCEAYEAGFARQNLRKLRSRFYNGKTRSMLTKRVLLSKTLRR